MRLLLMLWVVMLTGCAGAAVDNIDAIKSAGVTSYEDEVTIVPDGHRAVRSHRVVSGKELEEFRVTFKAGEVAPGECGIKEAEITARGVKAFEGQAIAAAAVVQVQAELTKIGIEVTDAVQGAIALGIRAALGGGVPSL